MRTLNFVWPFNWNSKCGKKWRLGQVKHFTYANIVMLRKKLKESSFVIRIWEWNYALKTLQSNNVTDDELCVGVGVVGDTAARLGLVGSDAGRLRRAHVESAVRHHQWCRSANCHQAPRCHLHCHVYHRLISSFLCLYASTRPTQLSPQYLFRLQCAVQRNSYFICTCESDSLLSFLSAQKPAINLCQSVACHKCKS